MQKYFQRTINSHLPRKKKLDFMGIVLMKATPLPHIYNHFWLWQLGSTVEKNVEKHPPNLACNEKRLQRL